MIRDDWQNFVNEWSKLIARAWSDSSYKEKFIADPKSCFREAGLALPDEVDVRVDQFSSRWRIESSSDFSRIIFTVGLPPKPTDLSEDLLRIASNSGILLQQVQPRFQNNFFPTFPCCFLTPEESPSRERPTTEPPATEPPTTEPPTTEPPVTEPPTTEPPAN